MLRWLVLGIGMWSLMNVKKGLSDMSILKSEMIKSLLKIKELEDIESIYNCGRSRMLFIKDEYRRVCLDKKEKEEEIIGGLMSLSRHGEIVSDLSEEYKAYKMVEKLL